MPGGIAARGLRKIGPSELAGLTLVIDGARDWLGPAEFADTYPEAGHAAKSVSFAGVTLLRDTLRDWLSERSGKAGQKRRGPKPRYDWEALEQEALRLLDENGDFDAGKPHWNAQRRLEDKLLEFYGQQTATGEPSLAQLRKYLGEWLTDWREENK
jgi:hypothetical protein